MRRRPHSNFLRTGVTRRKASSNGRGKRPFRMFLALSAAVALTIAGLVQLNQSTPVKAAPISNTALKWTRQTPAGNAAWQNVTWSPELNKFVAVGLIGGAPFGTDKKIMTSPDGKTWALHGIDTSLPNDNRNWLNAVAWSPELNKFVAVSCGTSVPAPCNGALPRTFQSSSDGVTWSASATPNDGYWESIAWSPALDIFVTVASGSADGSERVMTSPDGITWTERTPAEVNAWNEVTWSPDLNLFVAVASTGNNRVMTSPDGITWTGRTAAAANSWQSVTWSPGLDLLVAVSTDGANRVMTSPDGINWTIRTAPEASTWQSITWSADLSRFVAVADTGTNKLMTSPDGISWTAQLAASSNPWESITWSPELDTFVAVAGGGTNSTKVMTGAMITATTSDATSITQTSAVLHGDYQDPFPGANVFFRYRLAGSSDAWSTTAPQAVTAAGAFAASPTGLTPGTNYEFKAVVQWLADGGTSELEGGLLNFTTLPTALPPGVTIEQVTDGTTGEDLSTGSFTIRLNSQPSAPVTIALSSSNTAEGTVPASITIQPENWDKPELNVVTITGVDDAIADGPITYDIITGDVTSADTGYDALTATDVADVTGIVNNDNDPPGIVVDYASATDTTTTEAGKCAAIRFSLLSQPTGSVTIPVSVDDTTEATLNGVTEITITAANWNQPQNNVVTVCGVDDDLIDGDVQYHLVTGASTSSDTNYVYAATGTADLILTNTDPDSDEDGIKDEVETACVNDGDGNNDGIQDNTQSNVTCFVNPVTNKYAVLEVDGACQNTTATMKAESANAAQDAAYEYPAGLMDFTTDCGTPGFAATVKQYVYGIDKDYTVRKFNTNTKTYSTIDDATLAHVTIAGQAVTTASYKVTDGGGLDMDGAADGVIVDPAGLALASTTGGGGGDLADTGQSQWLVTLIASGLLATSGALFIRKRSANKLSK